MKIFSTDTKSIEIWGPNAAVKIKSGAFGETETEDWILVEFSIGAKEIVDIRQCFDDVSYIYAMGNDQGQCAMTLTFAIFIGRKNCREKDNLDAVKRGMDAYVRRRISQRTAPEPITIGSFSRMGWIKGIDIGQLDASKGICYGTVHFIMELDR